MRAISPEVRMNFIRNMCSEILGLRLLPHLPGDNELMHLPYKRLISVLNTGVRFSNAHYLSNLRALKFSPLNKVVVVVVVVVVILLTLGVKTDPWVIQNNIKYHKIKLNG